MPSTQKVIAVKKSTKGMYRYGHSVNSSPREISYDPQAHIGIHHGVEIFVLLKGEIEFLIENSTYRLSPGDILLINETEMHTFRTVRDSEYERIVLQLLPSFFEKYDIGDFRRVFTDRTPGSQNRIPGYTPEAAEIFSLFMRLERYIKEKPACDKVLDAVLIELLYLLNTASLSEGERGKTNETVAEILRYINDRLAEPLSLDEIADAFYISKYHLCRIFKKNTGFSIKDYITNKRIVLVQSLCREGMGISEAAARAGFGNYSNFYRIYVSRTGHSPRETLKKGVQMKTRP